MGGLLALLGATAAPGEDLPVLVPPVPALPVLEPGAPLVRSLAAGESFTVLTTRLAAGHAYLLTAEQRGVDVEVTATPIDGAATTVDGPWDRQGREELLLEPAARGAPPAGGELAVALRAREAGAPAGEVAVELADLGPAAALPADLLAAWRAGTRAGVAYARDTREERRRALDEILAARSLWQALGRPADEARALYAAAVLARLIDEPRQDQPTASALAAEALGLWQRLGERFWAAGTENELGLDLWLAGRKDEARGFFEHAFKTQGEIGDAYGQAVSQSNRCLVSLSQGDLRGGLACYEDALPRLAAVAAPALEAAALGNVGRVHELLGEPEAALAAYAQALARLRAAGDTAGEARVLANLAVLHQQMGELDAALADHGQALEVFRRLGDRRWQARVLLNLALLYLGLKDDEQAAAHADQALPLWRELGDQGGEAATLTALGLVALHRSAPDRRTLDRCTLDRRTLDRGELALARERLERALALRQATADRLGEGIALTQLARVDLAGGDAAGARARFRASAEELAAVGDRVGEIEARRGAGEAALAAGDPAAAREDLERAITAARAAGYRPGEAQALYGLARTERQLGHAPQALAAVEEAWRVSEGLRAGLGGVDLRTADSARQAPLAELEIDLLLAAHAADPAAGFDRRAFAVSERARARTLREELDAARVDLDAGLDPELLSRRRSLSRRLSALLARRWSRETAVGPGTAASNTEEQELLAELDRVEAELRAAHPAYATLTAPPALTVEEMQAGLDDGTLLLSYSLGEERSTLWALTRGSLSSFALPPRREIEAAVAALQPLLAHFDPADRPAQAQAAEALSRLVLAPVAARLDASRPGPTRLAIVPDGALGYVPFGALPLPPGVPGSGEPLLATHEVVLLPSLAVLAAERRLLARPPAGHGIVLLADPVFDAGDPRVSPPRPGASPSPNPGTGTFPRLPGSRQEATAIAALAPPGEAALRLDFAASREDVLDDGLRGFRVVHFATHGLIDAERPAASGLALSLVGPAGEPREGFLHLRDLYRLHLDADLVVLSGCRTAFGREVRGEGLIGLARGFLYAGAPRVVASLWPVDDRATAELMQRFYRGLWQDGLAPAAALRQAQLAIRQQRRWQDPFFWAGFVAQGPW